MRNTQGNACYNSVIKVIRHEQGVMGRQGMNRVTIGQERHLRENNTWSFSQIIIMNSPKKKGERNQLGMGNSMSIKWVENKVYVAREQSELRIEV